VRVEIPLSIEGLPAATETAQLRMTVSSPDGTEVTTDLASGPVARDTSLVASMWYGRNILTLTMRPDVYQRISRTPVTLRGHLLIQRAATSGKSQIVGFGRADIPQLGKCATTETGATLFQRNLLRIACESPNPLPPNRINVVDTVSGRKWEEARLGIARTLTSVPTGTWLSPLDRGEYYLQTPEGDATKPGEHWNLPEETLNHFRTEFQTSTIVGDSVVPYELTGIDLRKFVVEPVRR
jgi:hypothetical protein